MAILSPLILERPLIESADSFPAESRAQGAESGGAAIPRGRLSLTLLVGTLAAMGLSWLVASRLGGDASTLRRVLEACAIGIPATFAPVMFRIRPDYWALSVVGAGVARMLLCLGFCFAVREASPEVLSRPLFLGVGTGASLLLAVEVASSIRILSAIERGRAASGAGLNTRKAA